MENIGIDLKKIELHDFEAMKERIFIKLVGKGYSKEILSSGPCTKVCDLDAVYGLLLNQDDSSSMTMHVNYQIVQGWELDEKNLFEWALKNTQKLFGVKIASVTEIFKEQLAKINEGDEVEENCKDIMAMENLGTFTQEMYVISNEKGINGAAAMLIPGVLKSIAEKIGGNLVIIPSSVHEVLVFGADYNYNIFNLNELIIDVNKTLEENEVLSEHAYFYNFQEDKLSLA